jgi:transcriptional regulator of NAD metabolism
MFKNHEVVTDEDVGNFIKELHEQGSTPLEEIQHEMVGSNTTENELQPNNGCNNKQAYSE